VTSLVTSLLIGAGLGALLGRFGQCSSGACPLTANWRRGAIYGGVLGLMFYLASGRAGGSYAPPKHIKPVAEGDFETEVRQAGRPVVVDFFATWCGPCKTLAPRLDALAGEYNDRIKFVSVDIDQAPSLASKYKVEGVPTLLFFGADGNIVNASIGLISKDALRAKLESLTTTNVNKPAA
jgi:thioredoxin 1